MRQFLSICILISLPVIVAATQQACFETSGEILTDHCGGEDPGFPMHVAAGKNHACAIYVSGQVFCWGDGSRGQLGNGSFESSSSPVRVQGICDAGYIIGAGYIINAGDNHTCIVGDSDEYNVLCWGANESGQLGDGTTEDRATPVVVPDTAQTRQIGLGSRHSCVSRLVGDGHRFGVYCWGANDVGQITNASGPEGTTASSFVDLELARPDIVSHIDAGGDNTCIRSGGHYSGSIRCWGSDYSGIETIADESGSPIEAYGDEIDLTVGLYHVCNSASDYPCDFGSCYQYALRCWGSNRYGQLGCGEECDGMSAEAAIEIRENYYLGRMSAGSTHSCTFDNDSLFCWGDNENGQLGIDPVAFPRTNSPELVPLDEGAEDGWSFDHGLPFALSAGHGFTCAIKSKLVDPYASGMENVWDKRLYCWGANDHGQLGRGYAGDSSHESMLVEIP